jgi:hypothetical protein
MSPHAPPPTLIVDARSANETVPVEDVYRPIVVPTVGLVRDVDFRLFATHVPPSVWVPADALPRVMFPVVFVYNDRLFAAVVC